MPPSILVAPLSPRPTSGRLVARPGGKARKIRPASAAPAAPVIPTAKLSPLFLARLPPLISSLSVGNVMLPAASNVISSSAQDPRFWPRRAAGNLPVAPSDDRPWSKARRLLQQSVSLCESLCKTTTSVYSLINLLVVDVLCVFFGTSICSLTHETSTTSR